MNTITRRELTRGQQTVLTLAAVPMVAVGGFGAWGTYSNVVTEFGRAATAAGVVAAGEGLTFVLALVLLVLTMFGQPAPVVVRIGLWAAPLAASAMGVSVADNWTERVVYALTPLAMCGSAEGLGLLARRVVVYSTGVDVESDRRNAHTVQQLAYHQALAARHPDKGVRADSERKSWKLVGRVGVGDPQLAAGLVEVQRDRLREGADLALAGMLAPAPARAAVAVEEAVKPRAVTAAEALRREFAGMDPAEAIRLAHDARPDAPPAELASMLVSYGVLVDVVQVALVLGHRPAEYEVHRPDAGDAPQVNALPAVNLQGAVEEAASLLGPDAKARDIAEHLKRQRRLVVDEPYIRAALSRAAKKQQDDVQPKDMEGGYA